MRVDECGHRAGKRLATYDGIIADYISRFRNDERRETRWFAIQKSLRAAIENAASSSASALTISGEFRSKFFGRGRSNCRH